MNFLMYFYGKNVFLNDLNYRIRCCAIEISCSSTFLGQLTFVILLFLCVVQCFQQMMVVKPILVAEADSAPGSVFNLVSPYNLNIIYYINRHLTRKVCRLVIYINNIKCFVNLHTAILSTLKQCQLAVPQRESASDPMHTFIIINRIETIVHGKLCYTNTTKF